MEFGLKETSRVCRGLVADIMESRHSGIWALCGRGRDSSVVWVPTDGYRAVNVMKNVVADAAKDRASQLAETPGTHHHHGDSLFSRQVHDRLSWMLAELHHHPPGHLTTPK